MQFSLHKALELTIAVLAFALLFYSFSTFIGTTEAKMESTTVEDSYFPNDMGAVSGTSNPTLTINENIRINTAELKGKNEAGVISVIRDKSGVSAATDIKLQFGTMDHFDTLIEHGGVITARFSIENSNGRKTALLRNIIVEKELVLESESEAKTKAGA